MPAATPETTKMPAPITAPKPIVMASTNPSCRFSRPEGEGLFFKSIPKPPYESEQITPINM